MQAVPLNKAITKDEVKLRLTPDFTVEGPDSFTFAPKAGSRTSTDGVPLKYLIAGGRGGPVPLHDGSDDAIAAFAKSGVQHLHLVVYGPDRPNGYWGHRFRSISTAPLRTKADLAMCVALEYKDFCMAAMRKGPAPSQLAQYEPLVFENVSLVSLKKVTGNVYQAELKGGAPAQPSMRKF